MIPSGIQYLNSMPQQYCKLSVVDYGSDNAALLVAEIWILNNKVADLKDNEIFAIVHGCLWY